MAELMLPPGANRETRPRVNVIKTFFVTDMAERQARVFIPVKNILIDGNSEQIKKLLML